MRQTMDSRTAWRNALLCVAGLLGAMQATAQVGADRPEADSLYRSKGDHHRSYWFAEANRMSPYRVYVPSTWTLTAKPPLVVILHGANLDENAAFERAPEAQKGLLIRLAEERGYVLAAVNGLGGAYGNALYMPKIQGLPRPPAGAAETRPGAPVGGSPPSPNAARLAMEARDPLLANNPRLMAEATDPVVNALSEKDVTNIVLRMVAEYNVDRSRIYLMGNSMGSIGTFYLATKYPKLWRAIAPSDGPPEPTEYPYDRLGVKAVLIIGGDQDRIADPQLMQALQKGIQAQGIDARYYDVPGGTHPTAWYIALPRIFDFFDEIGK